MSRVEKKPIVLRPGMTLSQVLAAVGWRTEPSIVPGRRRIYDREGLVNVANEEETWQLLEDQGLLIREEVASC